MHIYIYVYIFVYIYIYIACLTNLCVRTCMELKHSKFSYIPLQEQTHILHTSSRETLIFLHT